MIQRIIKIILIIPPLLYSILGYSQSLTDILTIDDLVYIHKTEPFDLINKKLSAKKFDYINSEGDSYNFTISYFIGKYKGTFCLHKWYYNIYTPNSIMLYDIKDNTLVLEYKDKLNSYFIDHETKDELELWHYKSLLVNFTVSLDKKTKRFVLMVY